MHPFTYHRARDVADAVARLASDPDARPLSGGMTLLPSMKHRLAAPSQLIDLSDIAAMRGISREGGELIVGAGMRHAEVAEDAMVRATIPALADVAGAIGDPQVRARGTLGGSVANNDPAADYPAAVLALDAVIVTDRRRVAAQDFFTGMFSTVLAPDEIVVALRFRVPAQAAYRKFAHPASGYAMTGAFVARHAGDGDDRVRVAITGAAPCVFRWREAEHALGAHFDADAVAPLALSPDGLNADLHAPASYRANLARVMTMRALDGLNTQAPAAAGGTDPHGVRA